MTRKGPRDTSWIPRAKEMLEGGATYTEVGAAVGRSLGAVRLQLPGYGLQSKHYGWKPRAKELLEQGMSYREVGRTLHHDHNHIRRVFPGYGFTIEETQMVRQANAMLKKLGA